MKLTKLKILIAIPTYKRVGAVTTLELFDDPVLFVDSFEVAEYKKHYRKTKIIKFDGKGLVPKRNFILEYARKNKYDCVVQLDDDFTSMCYFAETRIKRMKKPGEIYQVIERMAVNARDAGTPMFSVADIPDPRKYSRNKPFTLFKTQKIGMYGLFLDNDLRYDERFILQEDVDLCLQVLLKYRYVWTDARYSFYGKPVMGNKGGCVSFRNQTTELKMHELLKKKWGYDRFTKTNSKRVQSYTMNIVNPFK